MTELGIALICSVLLNFFLVDALVKEKKSTEGMKKVFEDMKKIYKQMESTNKKHGSLFK